jgi:aryl-alcohol dehydrogenase-like predicted oxidoreductase
VETHVLPVTEQYGLGVLAWSPLASGWLSGAVRAGQEITTSRSALLPERFDLAVPANRARLDAVEQLAKVADEAGLTMIQLALGFVTAHPAVTSAIVGPRTLDHLHAQLAAADTVLPADVLDEIDAIVAPGVDLAPDEKYDTPPALLDPSRRRR